MKKIVLLCTTALLPSALYAQSTGTVTTEEQIVITGAKTKQVGGFQVPDTTKAKAVISQELIARQQPGQTILNVINLVPGVNFTNADPYGSSGGNIRIRLDSTCVDVRNTADEVLVGYVRSGRLHRVAARHRVARSGVPWPPGKHVHRR